MRLTLQRSSSLAPRLSCCAALALGCALTGCGGEELGEATHELSVTCLEAGAPLPDEGWLCGEPRVVECGTHEGAWVETIHASLDGQPLEPTCNDLELVPSSAGPFPVGEHLIAVSEAGQAPMCSSLLTVVDTTPPSATPGYLEVWPPNHELFTLSPDACAQNAADVCDPSVSIELLWASSDEPADAKGDGDTEQDIVDLGCDGVQLRGERAGTEDGRVYSVGYRVSDLAGNATEGTCTVAVRHDQGDGQPVPAGAADHVVELRGCQ